MRRIVGFILLFILLFTLVSCSRQAEDTRIDIVCTAFAQYDWVRELTVGVEDKYDITLLTDNGSDIHNYQPTTEDMVTISEGELLIYIGGSSDLWVEDMVTSNTKLINMTEYGKDEHMWLSIDHAADICRAITDELCRLDQENEGLYLSNAEAYIKNLSKLDEAYKTMVDNAEYDTLIFADRYPFTCMAQDYGITCYAAFSGCGAEAETTFETKMTLVDKLNELGLPCVVILENSSRELAESIISETETKDQEILVMNSMQSVTEGSYIEIMKDNLEVLKTALKG